MSHTGHNSEITARGSESVERQSAHHSAVSSYGHVICDVSDDVTAATPGGEPWHYINMFPEGVLVAAFCNLRRF